MAINLKRGLLIILAIIVVIGLVNYVVSCGGGTTVQVPSTTEAIVTSTAASTTTTGLNVGPTVVSVTPSNGATGVLLPNGFPTDIKATFNKGIDINSINNSSITLASAEGAVPGTVAYDETTKTLTYHASTVIWFYGTTHDLYPGVTYTATVSADVKDFTGTGMGTPFSWSFTTEQLIPPPTILPASGTYSAGQTITVSIQSIDGATIYYTTDRTDPRSSPLSTIVYGKPFNVTVNQTQYIKAYAVKSGMVDSSLAIAIYAPPSSGGNAWHALGSGLPENSSAVLVDGADNVYAGSKGVYKWDGSNWNVLGGPMDNWVTALAAGSGSDLYAGGYFSSAAGVPANLVAKWNGSAWSALADYLNGFHLNTLYYDKGNNILYAGGNIYKFIGGNYVQNLFRFDGSAWTSWGTGANLDVYSIGPGPGGKIYAGGYFTLINGVSASRIASWNGSNWEALGSGLRENAADESGVANCAAIVYDAVHNMLYTGGSFLYAGSVAAAGAAKWNGSSWSALGSGVNQYGIYALAYDPTHGVLYAGGYFNTAGGSPAYYVAQWNGSAWQPLGNGMDGPVNSLAVDSSGNLYAAGYFNIAGDVVANHVARWGP